VAQLPTADRVIDFHLRSVPAGLGQCSGMTPEPNADRFWRCSSPACRSAHNATERS
jgi:hypothetical protein